MSALASMDNFLASGWPFVIVVVLTVAMPLGLVKWYERGRKHG